MMYSSESRLLPQCDARMDPLILCQTLNSAPGNAAFAEKNSGLLGMGMAELQKDMAKRYFEPLKAKLALKAKQAQEE